MVRRVVGWLAAMVAALITMPAADAIAIESVQPLATHTYDSPPAPTADAYTHYDDRGPPSVLVDLHRHGAGGPGPRGTSAQADGVVTATTYTYDSSAELVLVEHRVGLQALKPRTTTGVEGLILGGAASALHSAGVAAKSVPATNKSYFNRALQRMADEPGPMHNFPGSFDETAFSQGTRTVNPGYFNKAKPNLGNDSIQYRLPGPISPPAGGHRRDSPR
jgi:hypothetical protein